MTATSDKAGALDAEELLHLALQAMDQDRDEDALGYLKRGVALEPRNGLLHHLLGAMYAQLGMIDRAIAEMRQAIELAPQLSMARFQLGLLHFTSTNVAEADQVWAPLAELPDEHPLRLFRSGLLHLARDDFAACVRDLRRGLEVNQDHPSLNHDMNLLAEMAERALAESAGAGSAPAADSEGGRHILLSGYEELGTDRKTN